MWWGIGIGGAILYFIVAFTLGLMTLRKGHWVMFLFGLTMIDYLTRNGWPSVFYGMTHG